jgi:hypothetical protein
MLSLRIVLDIYARCCARFDLISEWQYKHYYMCCARCTYIRCCARYVLTYCTYSNALHFLWRKSVECTVLYFYFVLATHITQGAAVQCILYCTYGNTWCLATMHNMPLVPPHICNFQACQRNLCNDPHRYTLNILCTKHNCWTNVLYNMYNFGSLKKSFFMLPKNINLSLKYCFF